MNMPDLSKLDLNTVARYAPALKSVKRIVKKNRAHEKPTVADYRTALTRLSAASNANLDFTDDDKFVASLHKLAADKNLPQPVVDQLLDIGKEAVNSGSNLEHVLRELPDILAQTGIDGIAGPAAIVSLLTEE